MNYDEAIKIMQGTEKIDENNILEKLMECFDNGKVIAFKKGEYEIVLSAIETAKKEHELLDLYRLLIEFKERYNTDVRLLDKQDALDNIREITDEIYELESELK